MYIYVDVQCNMAGVKKISPINWREREMNIGGNNFSPIIIIREESTVQTSMTVEFSPLVFDIYRRNKKNNRLDERVMCERPVKCYHECSDGTHLQG
jgi:hypothetical protein